MTLARRARHARPVVAQVMYNAAHPPARHGVLRASPARTRFTRPSTTRSPAACSRASTRSGAQAAKGSRFDENAHVPAALLDRPHVRRRRGATRAVATRRGDEPRRPRVRVGRRAAPGVDSILVGPASVEHLDAAIDGCAKALSPAARARSRRDPPRVPGHRRQLRQVRGFRRRRIRRKDAKTQRRKKAGRADVLLSPLSLCVFASLCLCVEFRADRAYARQRALAGKAGGSASRPIA